MDRMTRGIPMRVVRMSIVAFVAGLVTAGAAWADHHGGAAEAAGEQAGAAAEQAEAAAQSAAGEAEAATEATTDPAGEVAGDAAKQAADEAAEVEKKPKKCANSHWKFCEAANRCVLAWQCSPGTFPWPADSCECCARKAIGAGGLVRCVECLPKNCVFPQMCTDRNAALECRYEPPPLW